MPTRNLTQSKLTKIRERLSELQNSPLHFLATDWEELLKWETKADDLGQVLDSLNAILERIPKNDDRFRFDSYLIQSITRLWQSGASSIVIPTYSNIWAHEAARLMRLNIKAEELEFIYIKGEQQEDSPYLLDYAWLCHELGHHLHRQKKLWYQEIARDRITRLLNDFRLRSVADQGVARLRGKQFIDMLQQTWLDTEWLHEIAVDAIALWVCGPPYLFVYYEDHKSKEINPFLITDHHPPIEIRTRILISIAIALGWHKYTYDLQRLLNDWQKGNDLHITNQHRYTALSNPEFLDSIARIALDYCEHLGINKIVSQDIERIHASMFTHDELSDGIDVILAAWLVYQNEGKEGYEKWEVDLFQNFIADLEAD